MAKEALKRGCGNGNRLIPSKILMSKSLPEAEKCGSHSIHTEL